MGLFKRNKDKKTKIVETTTATKQTVASSTNTKTTAKVKSPAKVANKKVAAKPTVTKSKVTIKKESKKVVDKTIKTDKKQPTNTYYVTARIMNNKKMGWEVKRGNAAKVSAIVPTKEAALAKVKELAKNSKASVCIYRLDGSVEETYKINE